MTNEKLDLTKYEGHTPGPWKLGIIGCVKTYVSDAKNCAFWNGATTTTLKREIIIEEGMKRNGNLSLVEDAPLLLARVVELEAEVESQKRVLAAVRKYMPTDAFEAFCYETAISEGGL